MLTIPVKVDIQTGEIQAALRELESGSRQAVQNILDLNGKKINFEYVFTSSGTKVLKELTDQEVALRKLETAQRKQIVVQKGSITATRQQLSLLKQQRDGLQRNNPAWLQYSNAVKNAENKLRALQGIQAGSLSGIRAQRNELVQLRNAVKINSPEFKKLTTEIDKLDAKLGEATPKTNKFFQVLGKIAVAQAAFTAVSSAIRSVSNALSVYTTRTKEVESFNLAIQNVGFSQAETNQIFKQAAATANSLGAPVQQVEKSYKRMLPALQAVGTSSQDTDKFIAAISARTQTLGLNTEQSGRLLEAFAQVLSKGKLQAEELNQQISELDGAFRVQFADALGVTTEALNDLISNSKITAKVFVDTVNKMENGVENLESRVKNGSLTIQQFQNLISNLETKNIENIGKAVEPAIKSFLKLRLEFQKALKEFQKTSGFKLLVTVFNQSAKSITTLLGNIGKLIQGLNTLLSPLFEILDAVLALDDRFGGLISVVLQVGVAALVLRKSFALIKIEALISGVKGLTAAWAAFGQADLAGKLLKVRNAAAALIEKLLGLNKYTLTTSELQLDLAEKSKKMGKQFEYGAESAEKLSVGVGKSGKAALMAAAQFAIITAAIAATVSLVAEAIKSFRAYGDSVRKVKGEFQGVFDIFAEDIRQTGDAAKSADVDLSKVTGSIEKSANQAKTLGNSWQAAGAILGGVGIAMIGLVAALKTGGTSLIATGKGLAIAATGVAYLVAGTKTFQKGTKELNRAGQLDGLLQSITEVDKAFVKSRQRLKDLNGELGQVDFSNFAPGSVNLTEFQREAQRAVRGAREALDVLKEQLKLEKMKPEGERDTGVLKDLEEQIKKTEAVALLNERSAEAASNEIAFRIASGDAAQAELATVEQLLNAQELYNDLIEKQSIEARTKAIKEYGKEANAASLIAAAGIGIENQASEDRKKKATEILAILQKRRAEQGRLDAEGEKAIRDQTKIVAEETNRQAELQIEAQNAIIDAFEAGIDRAQQRADIFGAAVNNLNGAFDGVTGSLTSGLQSALGLVNQISDRELKGLEVGDRLRRDIVTRQLRAQGLANAIETNIARVKLAVQNQIAQSEARISQIRLRTEAAVARARGQTDLAKAYEDAAAIQGQVISALQVQYNLESQVLGIQKLQNDQAIINKGVDEKIAIGAEDTAKALGVQYTSAKQAYAIFGGIATEASGAAKALGDMVVNTQRVKENTELTALNEGATEAGNVKDALGDSVPAAVQLDNRMSQAAEQMSDGANEAQRIYGFIEAAVGEAGKLQRIVLSSSSAPARAMGGPVAGGQKYTVNDGGGREAFLSNSGKFNMLPAARNMTWTAPSSGTIIPAHLVNDFISASYGQKIDTATSSIKPRQSMMASAGANSDSGNLIKQMTTAMSASGGNQRITNHVTIQSQEPVTDASRIMTNVARMRLRNSRRI